jgi:hypothetical protein
LRQAIRIVQRGGRIAKEELARIDGADIRQSRVFQGGTDAAISPNGIALADGNGSKGLA